MKNRTLDITVVAYLTYILTRNCHATTVTEEFEFLVTKFGKKAVNEEHMRRQTVRCLGDTNESADVLKEIER